MSEDHKHRTVIIAAVDGTDATEDVIRTTVAAARGLPGAEIHYVHLAEPPLSAELPAFSLDAAVADGERVLRDAVARTKAQFGGRVATHLGAAFAAHGILQLASELEADLIVVGSHGKRGLRRLLLGSVSRAVVAGARCAVLVARAPDYPKAAAPPRTSAAE